MIILTFVFQRDQGVGNLEIVYKEMKRFTVNTFTVVVKNSFPLKLWERGRGVQKKLVGRKILSVVVGGE